VKRVYSSNQAAGWLGDQKIVLLSTDKIRSLGWKPEVSIEEGIKRTAAYLKNNL
jgi:nucleoside-diphosphate-sugar epimerase